MSFPIHIIQPTIKLSVFGLFSVYALFHSLNFIGFQTWTNDSTTIRFHNLYSLWQRFVNLKLRFDIPVIKHLKYGRMTMFVF